jgi:hypothetical protein
MNGGLGQQGDGDTTGWEAARTVMELRELEKHPNHSARALGIMLEAWDEAADHGVAPELMAYAALFTAFTDLVNTFGEEAVARMASGLPGRIERGEFSASRNLQ